MDVTIVAAIVGALVTAAAAVTLDRYFNRPRLSTYWGHVSSHFVTDPANAATRLWINTHSIVISNTGRATANNVRVGHHSLDRITVQLHPILEHKYEQIEGGGVQIVIPKLVGKSQVQLQYVGLGVRTDSIMVSVYCDEGGAKLVDMMFIKGPTLSDKAVNALLWIMAGVILAAIASHIQTGWPPLK